MTKNIVVITGGAGFVGSNLVDELVDLRSKVNSFASKFEFYNKIE